MSVTDAAAVRRLGGDDVVAAAGQDRAAIERAGERRDAVARRWAGRRAARPGRPAATSTVA